MSPSKVDNKTRMDNAVREVRRILQKAVDNGQERGCDMTAFKPGLLGAYRPPDGPLEIRPDYVPPLGFQEETYVPGHPSKSEGATGWAHFYTCIANGKRVYVWAFRKDSRDTCCVMLSDNEYDPQRGAEIAELQNMFVREHAYNKAQKKLRTHRMPCDPFLVQAFIHQLTLGGNNE